MVPIHHPLNPPEVEVRASVRRALVEDLLPLGDLTASLLDPSLSATAVLRTRSEGNIAGTRCVSETLRQVDDRLTIEWLVAEGDRVGARADLARISGPLSPLVTAERTALNFLSHLSGIATRVAEFVALAEGRCRIWDTRKTTPGLRALEKAAVRCGGGHNHRGNLSEWVMLKDNHLAKMGITEAIEAAHAVWPARTVHVECDRLDQVGEAVDAGAGAILLDNMTPEVVTEGVAIVAGRCLVEASGGINLDTVAAYSRTGVDCISVGGLTNSAPVLDIGLDIDAERGE